MCLIKIENVSKSFKLYHNMYDKVKNMFSFNKSSIKLHNVLKNVSLNVDKGETVAILGMNGCGKTTLLRLISGISFPDSGNINRNGKITSILSLGSGFHPDFSGLDNIKFYASIMGLSKKEIKSKIEEIVSFAEIGDFVNYPIKTYSAGMKMRLAFSTAISVDPDILVIDEVLAVGDAYFKKKCLDRFKKFKEQGKTIIFASHSLGLVKQFCERAIILNDASIFFDGEVGQVDDYYKKLITKRTIN